MKFRIWKRNSNCNRILLSLHKKVRRECSFVSR